MKTALKKISSFVMAAAVFLSLTPVTGQMILADEAETEAPAAVTETEPVKEKETEKKETEKPKATEKDPEETKAPEETEKPEAEAPKETQAAETEAPKETEKAEADTPKETEAAETEAPKETEATEPEAPKETEKAETEAPKETVKDNAVGPKETEKTDPEAPKADDKTEADTPENVPGLKATKARKKAEFSNVKITNGYLTWNPVNNCEYYSVYIDQFETSYSYDDNYECKFNLKNEINRLVQSGEFEKKNSYTIRLTGYVSIDEDNEEEIEWTGRFDYTPNVNPPSLGAVKAAINNGYLTWTDYKGAKSYCVTVDGWPIWGWNPGDKLPVNKEIDWLIMSKNVEKKDSYRVRITANTAKYDLVEDEDYDDEGKIIAQWAQDYKYSSRANPNIKKGAITGFSIEDGYAKWNKCNGANGYVVTLTDNPIVWPCVEKNTSCDIQNALCRLIDDQWESKKSKYTMYLEAVIFEPCDKEKDPHTAVVIASHEFTYKFAKASNRLSVTGNTAKAKRKKNTKLARSKVMSFSDYGAGKLTFKKTSGSKKIKIDKKTGKITVKKGLKKKTYKIKVKVSAAGNYGFNPGSTTITIKIKVK